MKGLDLRNFHKTKEDHHSATLRHPDGHEIRVAKEGLSPELKERLSGLPFHNSDEEEEYAEGGSVQRQKDKERNSKIEQLANKITSGPNNPLRDHPGHGNSPWPPRGTTLNQTNTNPKKYSEGGDVDKKDSSILALTKALKRAGNKGVKGVHESSKSDPKGGTSAAGEYAQFGAPGSFMDGRPESKRLHKEKLSELKSMKKPALMAEGTDPEAMDQQPLEDQSVQPMDQESQEPVQSPEPAQAPNSQPMQGQPQGTDQSMPSAPQQEPFRVPTPDENRQYLNQETLSTGNDMAAGHIKPKTYKDLYEEKSTLGKIGHLFGLLVSGAGAGLSHQPNALLGMMNQEINNDLDAQEKSSANAQNFLRLRQQQQLNEADIPAKLANGLINEKTADILRSDAEIKARTLAHNDAVQATIHDLTEKAKNDPKAMQILGAIYPEVNTLITNKNDQAALLSAYSRRMGFSGGSGGPGASSSVNYDKLTQLQRNAQAGVPGAPPSEDFSHMTREATMLDQNEANRKLYNNAFDQLDKQFAAGRLTPAGRQAAVADLGAAIGNHDLANKLLPEAGNWNKSRKEIKSSANSYFDAQGAATPKLNQWGVRNSQKSKEGSSSPSMMTGTNKKNGRATVSTDGGKTWKYK